MMAGCLKGCRLPLFLCFFLAALLGRARAQGVWTDDFVNIEGVAFDFSCPEGTVMLGIASVFRVSFHDRQWQFQCGAGSTLANVSTTCTLQPPINTATSDVDFVCPNDGYLGGMASTYVPASFDRQWRPYCCERPFSSLIDCDRPTAGWENDLRDPLNFTAPPGHVISGVTSFFFNRDRRWRFDTCVVQVNCTDPGTPANSQREGDSFLFGDSVTYTCNHGYYQSDGPESGVRTCLENGLWSGTEPVCTACTSINNCADVRCTNASDHLCHLCDSDNGPAVGQAAYRNLGTECLPLCSWLQAFCYPGTCPDDLSSCSCYPGFTGPDCLNITVPPDLLSCRLTIRGSSGSELQMDCLPSPNSSSSSSSPHYTNILPHELDAEWSAVFPEPSPYPNMTAYVEGADVGVVSSDIHTSLFRAANPTMPVSMVTYPCAADPAPSPDAPLSMSDCTSYVSSASLSNHTFLHGDIFMVEAIVVNGGYLLIRDLDTLTTTRHYYSGTPTVAPSIFILDTNPPVHCSLSPSMPCIVGQTILDVGEGITASEELAVRWGGWHDNPAGVVSYSVNIYRMTETDGTLKENALPVNSSSFNHTGQTGYEYSVNVSEGAFSVVLQMQDLAGNVRYSRQLVLVDATSQLLVDNTTTLQVDSAVPETGFLWLNSTTTPIIVSGRGHFYNTHFRTQDLLSPVANFSPPISPDYDHPLDSGEYPRGGTPNALGVTELRYQVAIDQEGGRAEESLSQPSSFSGSTSDLALGGAEVAVEEELLDGDSVRVWFQTIDYVSHTVVDSVLFHVDSSPPELNNLWLEWNGVTGLALHGTETLLDLHIQFQTSDPHSGVFRIQYWIGTEPGSSDVASGNVPVQRTAQENCTEPECVCDILYNCSLQQYSFSPLSSDFTASNQTLHDTEYYITVTATNHARLTSSLIHKFTTDTTPPLTGVVMDAVLGSHDLDYQQNETLSAWWTDFFDRETSILLFQYHFGTECRNSSLFSYPLPQGSVVGETTGSTATWTAPGPGTYYVTVVAYNHALQPSLPACSDGITIDRSLPLFEGVVVPGAVVMPGIVWSGGEVWVIGETRERWRVRGGEATEACMNQTTTLEDLSQYPISSSGGGELDPSACLLFPPFSPSSLTYLTTDHHLNISWTASDDTGIYTYHVAAASSEDFLQGVPLAFSSTAGQPHFSIHQPSLLTSGNTFYIVVWATDLAQHQGEVVVGPIRMDISPPIVNGSLDVGQGRDHVIVTWEESTFADEESSVVTLDYSIGTSEHGIQILPFTPLPSTPSPLCSTPHCLTIVTPTLPLLSGHTYYIALRVQNGAGLTNHISAPFTHIQGPPSGGRVIDLDPQALFNLNDTCLSLHDSDTDLLLNFDWLAARWEGFDHAHLNVTFSVGLGSIPGTDDIVPFTHVGGARQHSFLNTSLAPNERYYVTVVASNTYDSTNATSDGVLLLSGVEAALPYVTVIDGGEDGEDRDYQYSTSRLAAAWAFPSSLLPHISYYRWAVFLQDSGSSQLVMVRPFEDVGMQTQAVAGGLELTVGEVYIAAVQACLSSPTPSCLSPVYSDGVQILSHPNSTSLFATYEPLEWNADYATSSYGRLDIEWSPFQDPRMAYYEWAVGTGEPAHELLTEWNRVEWYEDRVVAFVNASISLHKPNTVTLRGYNAAGLYSTIWVGLYWNVDGQILPQEEVPRSKLVVFDIPDTPVPETSIMDWRQLEYSEWDPVEWELDYTDSAHSLSAAWPDLRYTTYEYSVSTTPTFMSCDSPDDVTCGTTITNYVTILNLDLEDGNRYYVCVRATRSNAIHPSPSTPHTLTACSNGITVDLSPPNGSCIELRTMTLNRDVELGSGGVASGSGLDTMVPTGGACADNSSLFQASVSDVHIVWTPFQDVEWYGDTVHAFGVAYYEYAVGTLPGASDVIPFTAVGVVNELIVTGLRLQSGHTYYATVRAYDFTGQWSDVTSPGVTVDLTPPTGPTHFHLVNSDGSYSNIPFVVDTESGIRGMELGLGSSPGSSDLMEWTEVSNEDGIGTFIELAGISDGQLVFASLLVWNGAGLSAVYSSLGHTHDSTPPDPGTVYDAVPEGSGDADYTASLSQLSAHWSGFSDPHSHLLEYYWAIGRCGTCNDVQDFLSVGVATGATRGGLSLSPGATYYVTVRGCNAAGFCSEASSNGITVDMSPPIAGQLKDGYSGEDLQYQSSRPHIAAHWSGFHDPESSIQYFTISAGVWPGDDSLLPPTILPPTLSSTIHPISPPLSPNQTVYTTLVAHNNAGLSTTTSSDGVLIDDTPPYVANVTMDVEWAGSVALGTQYTNTALRVTWVSHDSLSPVNLHFWSILSYPGTAIPLDSQTARHQDSDTATDLSLADGATYTILAIGCNAAGLCSQEETTSVLVDSSPPVDGYFAVDTSSTLDLSLAVPGGMTWRNRPRGDSRIYLALYGFSDVHSGIAEYWAAVGSGFSQSDLTGGAVLVSTTQASDSGTRIGLVEMGQGLEVNGTIYVTMWAVNGAGLESRRVQGSFVVEEVQGRTNNGTLTLLRSSQCSLQTCLGHCTCAARGDLCTVGVEQVDSCREVDSGSLPPEARVSVFNVAPQQSDGAGGGTLFTAVTDKLVGRWEEPDPDTSPFWRLEWTLGEKGASYGAGLFDTANDQIWREAGSSLGAIFSVNPLHPLLDGMSYVFYVRAWFNDTYYAVFESSGITVDVSGPQVVAGGRVREVGWGAALADSDYTANHTHLQLSWNGVFLSTLSGAHSTYQIGIGDTPGSDNVAPFAPVSSSETSAVLSGLQLAHGRHYYSTLQATSPLSVLVSSISDGFTVDLSPPSVGVVLDGLEYWDISAQSHTHSASARWTGFHDAESGIHHYELAVTDSSDQPDESEYENMGIGLRGTVTGLNLVPGRTYYAHVVAVNNAGVWSDDVSSNGITVDTSRPGHIQCTWNTLPVSSFEPVIPGDSPCPRNVTLEEVGGAWVVEAAHAELLPPSSSFSPLSGCFSLFLTGQITLSLSTAPNSLYTFSFWLGQQPGNGCGHHTPFLTRVVAPGLDQVIAVHTQTGDTLQRWSRYEFQFTADGPDSILMLATLSDQYGIVVDGLTVSECQTAVQVPIDDLISNQSSLIRVSQEHLSGSRTQLHARWEVGDGESGVREYLWAVGTVERGEQLQPYTSTGTANYGISEELSTFHAQQLYVSVVAWSHAGMETLVYGGPYVVDFTAPELVEGGGVWDGEGEDVDYQNSTTVVADWSAISDPESGVVECVWSIGSLPYTADLHPYTVSTSTTAQVSLPHLTHGTTTFTTVTCTNAAGLQFTATSDGVTVLLAPPTNDSAYLATSTPLLTQYPTWGSFLPSGNVTLLWGGFAEPAGTPLSYEVCVGELGCVDVGTDRQLTVDGLAVASPDLGLPVAVSAVNQAGLHSDPVEGRLFFQTEPPQDTGAVINATWIDGSLHFDWMGKFVTTPTSPLYFELSVGTLVGSGSIRKWVWLSTDHTSYTVVDSRLDQQTDYFLSLVAISSSGLHTTVTHMESAP